jgi:TetR/AcrR family transcriptional repressor of nem operon
MRYKPEHKLKFRQIILATAGKCLRQHGLNGIGVDGLMKEAGLTSGAFYTQFSSKTDLLAEVLKAGFEQLKACFSAHRSQSQQSWFEVSVNHYLSQQHCQNVAEGCLLPNLSVDVARGDEALKKLYETLLVQIVDEMETGTVTTSELSARQRAWATLALMVGGVMLARAMPEDETSEELLAACRTLARL